MDRKQKTLSMVQNARLVTLIEAEFTSRGETDDGFAKYASEKLGFEVNKSHINNRRSELGIPSSREPRASDDTRLAAIETQLKADQQEFRGLTSIVMDLQKRLHALEQVAKLKGTFEAPK